MKFEWELAVAAAAAACVAGLLLAVWCVSARRHRVLQRRIAEVAAVCKILSEDTLVEASKRLALLPDCRDDFSLVARTVRSLAVSLEDLRTLVPESMRYDMSGSDGESESSGRSVPLGMSGMSSASGLPPGAALSAVAKVFAMSHRNACVERGSAAFAPEHRHDSEITDDDDGITLRMDLWGRRQSRSTGSPVPGSPAELQHAENPLSRKAELPRQKSDVPEHTQERRRSRKRSVVSCPGDPLDASLRAAQTHGLRHKRATVMAASSDLVGMKPAMAAQELLAHASAMLASARECDGIVGSMAESTILVTWNAHRPDADHARQACSCALSLVGKLSADSEHKARWGIGVSTGIVVVGAAGGGQDHRVGVCAGVPVRLSVGLTCLSDRLRCPTLLSDKTYLQVRGTFTGRVVDAVKAESVDLSEQTLIERQTSFRKLSQAQPRETEHGVTLVYELIGLTGSVTDDYGAYAEAFHALRQKNYKRSQDQLVAHLQKVPGDIQAARLLRTAIFLAAAGSAPPMSYRGAAYARLHMGWDDIEAAALGSQLSPDLSGDVQRALNVEVDQPRILSPTSAGSKRGEEVLILREQIKKAQAKSKEDMEREQQLGLRRQVVSILASNMQYTVYRVCFDRLRANVSARRTARLLRRKVGDTDLPVEFMDGKGRRWYRGQKRLGKGAFGEVWMGMEDSGSLIALKSVKLQTAEPAAEQRTLTLAQRRRLQRKGADLPAAAPVAKSSTFGQCPSGLQKQIEELLHEVALMQRLQHENIIEYLGSCVVQGVRSQHIIILMEYMSGGSLMCVMDEFGRVPIVSLQRYMKDTLSGLAYLHGEGVIHRDMKPHNVLLLIDGQCKLADFGASAQLSQVAGKQETIGTPLYMSPEACAGNACEASDTWAIGIILCQCLTGEVPYRFTADQPYHPAAFVGRMRNDPSFEPTVSSNMPEDARAMVLSCLEKDPAKRPRADVLLTHQFLTD
eukprot:TRINITY_DN2308_c10_g1_i1.p1 TRINITY_DN2308_c10_g1~~TRINITY_DN2308_c10_g1_i1.p1  ORF type:complete len:969 (+),score=339.39 TRINITY_DN2308_c10_g1_i1:201-3107(+)